MQVNAGFSVRQAAQLLGLSERQLRYWAQTGFLAPSTTQGARSFYTFRDLVGLKVAKALLDEGIPLRRVRRSLVALAQMLPEGETTWASLRVRSDGDRIVVQDHSCSFEPATGQLHLDLALDSLRDEAAAVLKLPWVEGAETPRDEPKTAYDYFLLGCELEQDWAGAPADTHGFEAARAAYERALEIDEGLAAAWTNLGTMFAEIGELDLAREHFERSIAADPQQPEAHSNLAELWMRAGEVQRAVDVYAGVVDASPDWAEGHYGLARAALHLGQRERALAHLERFLALVERPSRGGDGELEARLERVHLVLEQLRRDV